MSSPHYRGTILPSDQYNKYIKKKGNDEEITINPRALDITWGGDNRYWHIDKEDGTAELVQVSWLEVKGSLDMNNLRPNAKYKLEFEVSLKPDAFGWNGSPVYMMVKLPGNSYIWKNADLTKIKDNSNLSSIPFSPTSLEFTVPQNNNDKLSFGLFEIWKGRWKGGLVIKNVKFIKVVPSS